MSEDRTVVYLNPVIKETTTNTSGSNVDSSKGRFTSNERINTSLSYNNLISHHPTFTTPPSSPLDDTKLKLLLGFIIGWLAVLTGLFYSESKEINNKISSNQEELIKAINSSQIDLKNQVSQFEREHGADIRDLQKLILENVNNTTQKERSE